MRFTIIPLLLFFAASLTAVAQSDGNISEAGDVYSDSQAIEATGEYELYGEPMPDVMEKFSLGDAVAQFGEFIGAEMQISGLVARMCGGEECYFMLEDGGKTAKVILVDPSAPMPSEIAGRNVTVFGMLEAVDAEGNPQVEASEDGKGSLHFRILTRSVRVNR